MKKEGTVPPISSCHSYVQHQEREVKRELLHLSHAFIVSEGRDRIGVLPSGGETSRVRGNFPSSSLQSKSKASILLFLTYNLSTNFLKKYLYTAQLMTKKKI